MAGGRGSPERLTGEKRHGSVLGYEHVGDVLVVGAVAFESLHIPSVGESDLLARQKGDPHVRDSLADPTHLTVLHREKTGADVSRVSGAGAEIPCTAQLVAAVDDCALAIGEVLTADGDVVVVAGEYFGETLVGKIRGGGEGRRQVSNADPAERTIL